MNVLTEVLEREIRKVEERAAAEHALQKNRLTHHLMPPTGWLNDPNGLCYYKGRYHVFFQYAPFQVQGGLKFWGHYSSRDLVYWIYEGVALYPDSAEDCHGVYSGSALVVGDQMHLFYTGNVKLEGNYDYIHKGRRASTLHVVSQDGSIFEKKKTVLSWKDYPSEYTCHVRDPKVWKSDSVYHMILGGRKKNDQGAVLLYQSEDLENWIFQGEITTEKPFGYMWECPDLFTLSGEKILSVSPQGLQREEERFQNRYQSGYFIMEEGRVQAEKFQEWDMGFDFYAPQTFEDEQGRRILFGWLGMADAEEEYTNHTIEENWQHCLTLPREVSLKQGRLYQYPVREIDTLRQKASVLDGKRVEKAIEKNGTEKKEQIQVNQSGPFDLELKVKGNHSMVSLGEDMMLTYKNGRVTLTLSEEAGAGRKQRNALLPSGKLEEIRILADTTAVEIYLNHGEVVFSSRYYPATDRQLIRAEADSVSGMLFPMDRIHVLM